MVIYYITEYIERRINYNYMNDKKVSVQEVLRNADIENFNYRQCMECLVNMEHLIKVKK